MRRTLVGDRRWDTLGQSYGGFVTLTYLPKAPEDLDHCYVTGGIPGITETAEDVYCRTFPRAADRSREYYTRYPEDEAVIARLVDYLGEHEVVLPDGDVLTPHRLRTLGAMFGMSYGFETLHWLLDDAWAGDQLHPRFLYDVQTTTGFVDNVLCPLQEYTYAANASTGWAAQRVYDRRPEFAADATGPVDRGDDVLLDVPRDPLTAPVRRRGRPARSETRLATAVRRGPPRTQRDPTMRCRVL